MANEKKPIGHYEGSRMMGRYWVGGCTCGSGKDGHELYDKKGIYAGITCSSCKKENTFAAGVMPGSPYDYPDDIGPIEPEDY